MLQIRPIYRNDEEPLTHRIEAGNYVKRCAANPVQEQSAGKRKTFGIVFDLFSHSKRCQDILPGKAPFHHTFQRMTPPFNTPVLNGFLQSFSIQDGLPSQCAQSVTESQFLRPESRSRLYRMNKVRDRTIITRKGKPAAVLMGVEEYESWMELF